MSETRFRIPRMTMAVMVFGGLGCGSDKSAPPSDTARLQKIADDECKLEFVSCPDWDTSGQPYTTQQECVDWFVNQIKNYVANVSADCKEAALTFYECYSSVGCNDDVSVKCSRQQTTIDDKCSGMGDSQEDAGTP